MLLNASGEEILSPSVAPVIGAAEAAAVQYEPPAPRDRIALWQAELDRLAPQGPHLTTLYIRWVPGDEWDPVNRWFIYQMYAPGIVPSWIDEADLKGPDPRTYAGYYDQVLGRFVRQQHISIDRLQWLLYQETGRYGTPYWVVQGSNGGHLRRFTEVQAALSKMEGGWTEPPAPGALPYAEPDARTWAALRELDDVSRWDGLVAFHLRKPEMVQGDMQKKAEEMRKRMWNQIRAQQEGYWSDETGIVSRIRSMLPHGLGRRGRNEGPDYEEIERRFIQDD